MKKRDFEIRVRHTRPEDFPEIQQICREVYTDVNPYTEGQLHSQRHYFPEGQFVAERTDTHELLGMAASLIVNWNEYEIDDNYGEFVTGGTFENHDSSGRTLYAAEVMVRPSAQGLGVGGAIYQARKELAQEFGLLRIRAGARLRGYHHFANDHTAAQYTAKVLKGELWDATISFQLRHGFRPLKLVPNYFIKDAECLGYALVIEWLNPDVATREDYELQDRTAKRFLGEWIEE